MITNQDELNDAISIFHLVEFLKEGLISVKEYKNISKLVKELVTTEKNKATKTIK